MMKLFYVFVFLMMSPQAEVAKASNGEQTVQAKLDYMQNCQGCHLAAGQGLPGSVPPMLDHIGHFLQVEGGREFLVQVPGSANAPISDLKLANLLNWIITTMSGKTLKQPFDPYSEEEVHKLRQSTLVNVTKVRKALVAEFHSASEN